MHEMTRIHVAGGRDHDGQPRRLGRPVTMSVATDPVAPAPSTARGVTAASAAPLDAVFTSVHSSTDGLTTLEAADRLRTFGPNTVASHKARLWPVVVAQLRSPLLVLLLVAAAVSFVVGERTDAVIIGVIVALSVGLGVVNEYRAAKAADLLHDQVQRKATVVRDGTATRIDVADVVPGDVVRLRLGDIVPADVRLFDGTGLACDESVLTGESMPIEKTLTTRFDAEVSPTGLTDLANCALMGTVVHAGTGTRRSGRNRWPRRVREDRRRAPHAQPGDRVPGRPAQVLDAAGVRRRKPERGDRRRQRRVAPSTPRRASCSRSPSPSASPHNCCPPSWQPASPPVRAGWLRARSW